MGAIAAVCVVFFWSGWIGVSRLGVTNHLTVYDVTGLRFSIGAAVALPLYYQVTGLAGSNLSWYRVASMERTAAS